MLAAACGGTSPAATTPPSPAGQATLSAAPTPTVAPSPTPSPTSTPTPSPTAAASEGSSSPPPASTPGGSLAETGRIVDTANGFAITLPEGWRRIPLGVSAADLARFFPPGSEMGQLIGGQVGQAAILGIKLWAFDFRPKSIVAGYAPNLSVIVQPATAGFSLATVKELILAQLKSITGVTHVEAAAVVLPAGDAVRTTYELQLTTAAGAVVDSVGIQFYVLGPKHVFVATFSCPQSAAASCSITADETIHTLQDLGP
jgi:hypothetical protein